MVESISSSNSTDTLSSEKNSKEVDYALDTLFKLDVQLPKSDQFLQRLYDSSKQEKLKGEELRDLFSDVNALLNYVTRIALPIKFKPSKTGDEKLSNVVYGECGSGKSTLQNFLMQRYSVVNKLTVPAKFAASSSSQSVTKSCDTMTSADGKFTVIDIPGTNDPGGTENQRLTNEVIA